MINALIAITYTRKHPEPHTGFEVIGSACITIEEARKEVESDNEEDNREEVVAFIPIDHADAGQHAFAALLALAIEADHDVQGVGIESLLTQVFMAGKEAL